MHQPDITLDRLLQEARTGSKAAQEQLFALLGDENHFGAVVLRMARWLLSHHREARRLLESHDLVQSAIRTGMCSIDGFRGTTEGELYGWLRSILRTKLNRALRRRAPRSEHLASPEESLPDPRLESPLSAIINQEMRDRLRSCIGKLPEEYRIIVELELYGWTASEIGIIFGLEPAAVRKRFSRAVDRIRVLYQAKD